MVGRLGGWCTSGTEAILPFQSTSAADFKGNATFVDKTTNKTANAQNNKNKNKNKKLDCRDVTKRQAMCGCGWMIGSFAR